MMSVFVDVASKRDTLRTRHVTTWRLVVSVIFLLGSVSLLVLVKGAGVVKCR